jgi:radical SAM protein with 4Fe4S-binding SPASM domain
MALRSNLHELGDIAAFCRQHTADYFRFDPLLHLRHDFDPRRNADIISERLTPSEIVEIEQGDDERARALQKGCEALIFQDFPRQQCDHLFHCGAGKASFVVSPNGIFRLCADLWHPDCIFNLRQGSLSQAWNELVPRVRELRSTDPQFLERCRNCPVVNLCLWCPAHAYLECGRMDGWSEYFCQVAHARAQAIQDRMGRA